jgi:hypothetical protein
MSEEKAFSEKENAFFFCAERFCYLHSGKICYNVDRYNTGLKIQAGRNAACR